MAVLARDFRSIWHYNIVRQRKMPATGSVPSEKSSQPSLVQALVERYQAAMASKLYDVEELIDFYFHRRLAAVIAVVVSYLPFVITPNQITLFGLALGWLSASFFHDAYFQAPFACDSFFSHMMASFFMFAWIVSDCADGQVARLCKRGTRTGRILDGVVDGLVLIPNFYVISAIMNAKYGSMGFYTTVAAGFSLWGHAMVYDKIKNVYSEHSLPESECDGETAASVYEEYVEAKGMDCVLLGIYHRYLQLQATFELPAVPKFRQPEGDEHARRLYRKRYGSVMRLASFLGISAHVTGFYTMYFFAFAFPTVSLLALHLYFGIVLNFICVLALYQYSTNGMTKPHPPVAAAQ